MTKTVDDSTTPHMKIPTATPAKAPARCTNTTRIDYSYKTEYETANH